MEEVYLFDNGKAIEVRNTKTDEMLYKFSYRHEGELIWNKEDAWRMLRAKHLKPDLYKEVFKCECGNILKIPEKFEAKCNEVNNIEFDLKCDCGEIITIQCDTLRVKEKD